MGHVFLLGARNLPFPLGARVHRRTTFRPTNGQEVTTLSTNKRKERCSGSYRQAVDKFPNTCRAHFLFYARQVVEKELVWHAVGRLIQITPAETDSRPLSSFPWAES